MNVPNFIKEPLENETVYVKGIVILIMLLYSDFLPLHWEPCLMSHML